jgi:hypothetical protein
MAQAGHKANPANLRGIKGGKKGDDTELPDIKRRTEPLPPPADLTESQKVIWKQYIDPAWWLTRWDVPIAYQFVCLFDQFIESPQKMITSKMTEMRRCQCELHLTSSEQARIGVRVADESDPAESYFA